MDHFMTKANHGKIQFTLDKKRAGASKSLEARVSKDGETLATLRKDTVPDDLPGAEDEWITVYRAIHADDRRQDIRDTIVFLTIFFGMLAFVVILFCR